jgi:hypothetical protein
MTAIKHSCTDIVGQPGTVFDRMLAILRCDVVNLVNAINRSLFLNAWLASMELERSLGVAKLSLGEVPETGRIAAGEQLASLQGIAERVQAMAPRPSATAILQAGSRRRGSSLSAWEAEEKAWMAARSAHGPVLIARGPDGITVTREGKP